MGIGMALHEDLLYDRAQRAAAHRRLLLATAFPRIATRRTSRSMFIESDDGYGPFGAKSMGESGKILRAGARSATRSSTRSARRMKDLPITRDKILGALGMKTFANAKPARRPAGASALAAARRTRPGKPCRSPAAAATCSALVKERIVTPDVIVSLRAIEGLEPGVAAAAAA